MSTRHWRGDVMFASEVVVRFAVDLKQCPFCGSRNIALWMGPSPHVTCGNCEADGPCINDGRKSDLIFRQRVACEKWNERATLREIIDVDG